MLTHLQIRDFVIVDHLELEFAAGMSAITGETGAGKSIMVDALGLLLGDRADSTIIRPGAERAEISASFDISRLPAVHDWLAENDLAAEDDRDNDCHLRRLIAANGRSRAYINGVSQPLQMLKAVGELMVDIYSQHEHQSLLKRDLQRQLLDNYAGHQHLVGELAEHFRGWSRLRQRLDQLNRDDSERDARLDLLKFQVQELEALALGENELDELEIEHKRLANAGRLLDGCRNTLERLYEAEDGSIHSELNGLIAELESLQRLDEAFNMPLELLNSALIQLEEASNGLRAYLQDIDLDPARLDWIEQRLSDIHELARKHRVEADALAARLLELTTERDALDNIDNDRAALARQIEVEAGHYRRCAETVTAQRRAAATELSRKVSAAMQELGMPGGRFEVVLENLQTPASYGQEAVEFRVSANPGQPPRPLSKVASGGELSRISLAIQVIAADSTPISTLIFDEVDSGIGGAVAEIVGQQLRRLSSSRQILCVTHLAQVAAQAHQQLKVQKQAAADTTQTEVLTLDERQRTEEIARMLGGLKLTKRTLAHAREMISHARQN
jgi:DNA repair protein RecN (Recombination protein N)